MLERSPLNRTSVPPDRIELVPSEARPTLIPLEIFEILTPPNDDLVLGPPLYPVISKFQIIEPGAVSVRTNV